MAQHKEVTPVSHVTTFNYTPLCEIWSFTEDNEGRDYDRSNPALPFGYYRDNKDRDSLVAQLLDNGWEPENGVAGLYELSDTQIKRAKKEIIAMEKAIDGMKEDIPFSQGEKKLAVPVEVYKNAFRLLHFDKDGEVIPPKYGLVWAHRRTMIHPFINAVRNLAGKPDFLEVPAVVKYYENSLARHLANAGENERRETGALKIGKAGLLKLAYRLYSEGCNQNLLRRTFSDGTGQKLWWFLTLNNMRPKAGLMDMVKAKPELFTGADKVDLMKLAKANAKEDEIKAYLEKPKSDGNGGTRETGDKVAKGAEIKSLATQSNILPIKDILSAVARNDLASLNVLIDYAPEINDWWAEHVRPILGIDVEPEEPEETEETEETEEK